MDMIKLIIFYGIMGMCSLGVLTGFLGLITAKYKTCCAIGTYSFLTFFLTILFIGLGGLMLCVNIASVKQIGEYCNDNKNYDKFTINFSRYYLSYVDDYATAT